jgi:hypothetical protein
MSPLRSARRLAALLLIQLLLAACSAIPATVGCVPPTELLFAMVTPDGTCAVYTGAPGDHPSLDASQAGMIWGSTLHGTAASLPAWELLQDYAVAFSRAAVLIILTLALSLLLRFIARQIEQNFPPARRYRGFKKALPALLGAGAGLLWSWVIATVIHWVVPVVAGQVIFLSPDVLYATDWYRFLWWTNPLLPLFALLG